MKKQLHFTDIELLTQLFVPTLCTRKIADNRNKIVGTQKPMLQPQENQEHRLLVVTNKGFGSESEKNYDTIIDFGNNKPNGNWKKQVFHYINNSDGTMRWLFSNNDFSSVLAFYPKLTFKSKCIYTLSWLVGKCRLGNLLSHGKVSFKTK